MTIGSIDMDAAKDPLREPEVWCEVCERLAAESGPPALYLVTRGANYHVRPDHEGRYPEGHRPVTALPR